MSHNRKSFAEKQDRNDISIGSLNVRGIRGEVKRKAVYEWSRKNRFDITFFQETYSSESDESQWINEWSGKIMFSHGTNHSKGTMILFRPGFDFKIISESIDKNGRYIILKMDVEGTTFIFL